MVGEGLIKGLYVTLKHFIGTYIDDIRWLGRRYYRDEAIQIRQSPKARGVFTVQYPEDDAIKMGHDYELASYNRLENHIYDKKRLSRPVEYYRSIRPSDYAIEETARAEKEAAKTARRRGGSS
ncbi:MAG: hypothetical protein P8Z42_12425 [Anaerolineales bacterium]